jgi:hypothetical protein
MGKKETGLVYADGTPAEKEQGAGETLLEIARTRADLARESYAAMCELCLAVGELVDAVVSTAAAALPAGRFGVMRDTFMQRQNERHKAMTVEEEGDGGTAE